MPVRSIAGSGLVQTVSIAGLTGSDIDGSRKWARSLATSAGWFHPYFQYHFFLATFPVGRKYSSKVLRFVQSFRDRGTNGFFASRKFEGLFEGLQLNKSTDECRGWWEVACACGKGTRRAVCEPAVSCWRRRRDGFLPDLLLRVQFTVGNTVNWPILFCE